MFRFCLSLGGIIFRLAQADDVPSTTVQEIFHAQQLSNGIHS
jgi:hypothetical protein